MSDDKFQLMRAVLRNAATWGAAWAAIMGTVFTAIVLVDPSPGVESLAERVGEALFVGTRWAFRFGLAGAVLGAAFSLVVRIGYRGRRLADINPLRFALLGAVVGGVGMPLYLQIMNVLSGDGPIAWRLVLDDAPFAAVFAAVVAGGSILLARRATTLPQGTRPDQVGKGDDYAAPVGGRPEVSMSPGTRPLR